MFGVCSCVYLSRNRYWYWRKRGTTGNNQFQPCGFFRVLLLPMHRLHSTFYEPRKPQASKTCFPLAVLHPVEGQISLVRGALWHLVVGRRWGPTLAFREGLALLTVKPAVWRHITWKTTLHFSLPWSWRAVILGLITLVCKILECENVLE